MVILYNFNSSLLQIKLGYQKDLKQLPGLIKPERDSLSTLCLILYKSYVLNKKNNLDFKNEITCYVKFYLLHN